MPAPSSEVRDFSVSEVFFFNRKIIDLGVESIFSTRYTWTLLSPGLDLGCTFVEVFL